MEIRRRVLVTGSSRGIGKAIALKLAQDGFEVTIHFRNNRILAEETINEVRAFGSSGTMLQLDVSDREECRTKLLEDIDKHGAYYGVVLNAGLCKDAPFPALDGEEWDQVIDVNLNGFYNVLQPLVMPMIQLRSGGRIVCMSSLAGVVGHRGQVNYSAAKAGIIGAARSLAQELAKRAITVNCIAPGFIESDMTASLPLEELLREIPMRRLGKPSEIGGLVSYLFSESAGYLTGQSISMNGGIL